jgi:4-amino-4-deoxy-L-arabinose transferase-like glycosyltransferase
MKKAIQIASLIKKEAFFLPALFFGAFIIRLAYTLQIQNLPPFTLLVMDAKNFHMLAVEILQTGWLGKGNFFIDPFYPYFLALIYSIFGVSFFAVRTVHICLGAATPVLMYYIGKNVCGKKTGIIASLISVFYGIFIFYTPILLKPTVYLFFETVCILCLTIYINTGRKRHLFLAGLMLGLMILTRGNTYITAGFLFIWLTAREFKSGLLTTAKRSMVFGIGILIILLPVGIRNFVVTGDPVIASASGGFNFYIGNNKDASGLYQPLSEGRQTPDSEKNDMKELAEAESGKKLSYAQASNYWFMKSLKWVICNPVDFLILNWHKLQLFFNHYEIPDTEDYYLYRRYSSVLNLPFISFGLLCPVALIGMFLGLKDLRKFSLLYVLFIANTVSVVMFFIFSRFRVPLVPLLILFAAHACLWLWNCIRQRNYYKAGLVFIAFLITYFFVNVDLSILKGISASSHFMLADSFRQTGDYKNAIIEYERALENNPHYVKVYNNLALVYYEYGRPDKTIELLNKAIEMNPHHLKARSNLAEIYLSEGNLEKAMETLQKSLDFNPSQPAVRNRLQELQQMKSR